MNFMLKVFFHAKCFISEEVFHAKKVFNEKDFLNEWFSHVKGFCHANYDTTPGTTICKGFMQKEG